MNISDSDIIRALKSDAWHCLSKISLDDLPASGVRDFDFGGTDSSVFLIPTQDWSRENDELEHALNDILVRLLFSSQKFHQPKLILFKLSGSLFCDDNLHELDDKCNCHHFDLVGITYGTTKKIIDSAFDLIKKKDPSSVRVYNISSIQKIIGSYDKAFLRSLFLELNPITTDPQKNKGRKHNSPNPKRILQKEH